MSTLEIPVYTPSKTLKAHVEEPPTLQRIEYGQPVPESCGILRVMLADHGDKRYAWNPRSIPEINEAKTFFDDCVREGLVPYKVGVGGNATSEVMDEFDPTAGEIIFMPIAAVAGG